MRKGQVRSSGRKSGKLRVGVIGLGMGQGHVNGFREHPGVEVVAAADVNEQRLQSAGERLKVPALYTSAEEMLRKEALDIVSVATPNKYHKPLTLLALKAGCHVLCEKPMAMNAAEAREMLLAARKARKRLMINFSFRFTPQSWALKKEVENGLLGKVYFARTVWMRRRGMPGFGGWFGQKALAGGGPLIDLGVHRLDLALWLMGHPKPVWVMGTTGNHIAAPIAAREKKAFDVEDFAAGHVKFEDGSTLEIEASWAGNIKENDLMETRILGSKGGLVQRNVGEGYEFDAEMYFERNGVQCDMKPHTPVPGVRCSMYHFADSILSGKPNIATGEEGLIVMQLLDAIYESARKGAPVKVR